MKIICLVSLLVCDYALWHGDVDLVHGGALLDEAYGEFCVSCYVLKVKEDRVRKWKDRLFDRVVQLQNAVEPLADLLILIWPNGDNNFIVEVLLLAVHRGAL